MALQVVIRGVGGERGSVRLLTQNTVVSLWTQVRVEQKIPQDRWVLPDHGTGKLIGAQVSRNLGSH